MACSIFILLAVGVATVSGHGRVVEPISRASAYMKGFPTPPDYDDDGVNCGGMNHQWANNNGKCGICGDAYDLPQPRPHELGGTFGQGVIVAHYDAGAIIPTGVQLTTAHRGFWEFKLCPDPMETSQKCFDKYPLELEDGGYQYYPERGSTTYQVNYKLPRGLVCEHCVLQWRYTAGNNWGDCGNGTQVLGCGNQEQFGACSDISIGVALYNEVDYQPKKKFAIKAKPEKLVQSPMFWDIQEDLKRIFAHNTKPKLQKVKSRKKQRHNSKKPKKKLMRDYLKKLQKHKHRKSPKHRNLHHQHHQPYSNDFYPSYFKWDFDDNF